MLLDHPWYVWVLAALFVVASVGQIYMIGKPRKPITPGQAAFSVVMNGVLIAFLFTLS